MLGVLDDRTEVVDRGQRLEVEVRRQLFERLDQGMPGVDGQTIDDDPVETDVDLFPGLAGRARRSRSRAAPRLT